jgi:hypothetical protein
MIMAKAGQPQFKSPGFDASAFKLPELKLPKVDLEAVFALQKANLLAAHEAQTVLVDAVQAIAKVHQGWVQERAAAVRALMAAKVPSQPQAVLADVQAAAGKAVAVTKEGVDLGLAAQRAVARLVSQRVQANVDELKALAA